jgi:ribosome maturation factor RimP
MASEQSLKNTPAFIKELLKAGGFEVVKVKCKRVVSDGPLAIKVHRFSCLGVRLDQRSECPLSAILRQVMDEEPGHSDDSVVETGVVVYSLCEQLSKPKRNRSGTMVWWPSVGWP